MRCDCLSRKYSRGGGGSETRRRQKKKESNDRIRMSSICLE